MPEQIPDVIPFVHNQSPLGLIGAFMLILGERFSPMNKAPWCYTGDPNVDTVHIYPQFDVKSEAANLNPRIVIAKGPTVYQRMSLGDLDQNQVRLLEQGIRYGHQLSETSWSISCISSAIGESAAIADYVSVLLADTAPILEEAFTLRRISTVLCQGTRQYDTDTKKWITEVEFRTHGEHRWRTVPAAGALRKYKTTLELKSQAIEYATQLIINRVP